VPNPANLSLSAPWGAERGRGEVGAYRLRSSIAAPPTSPSPSPGRWVPSLSPRYRAERATWLVNFCLPRLAALALIPVDNSYCRRGRTNSRRFSLPWPAAVLPKRNRRSSRSASSATSGPSWCLTALKDGRLIKGAGWPRPGLRRNKTGRPYHRGRCFRLAADKAERIRVNNRLRGAIEGALGELTLFHSHRSSGPARGGPGCTAASFRRSGPPCSKRALNAEKDSAVRAAMEQSRLASPAGSLGPRKRKFAAVRALGTTTEPQIKNLLDHFRAAPDTESRPATGSRRGDWLDRKTGFGWSALPSACSRGISLGKRAIARRNRAGDHVWRHGRNQYGAW